MSGVTNLSSFRQSLGDLAERLRSTIDHTIEGILWVLPSGEIVFANSSSARLLGYTSAADLLASGPAVKGGIYADPEDYQILQENCARDGDVTFECQLRRKDGDTVWVWLHAVAIRDEDGRLLYYEKFFSDITAQKHIEEAVQLSEARYRLLVENAVCGIYRSSLDGRFLEVNHALVAMLGYESRSELLALNIERDVYADPGGRRRLIEQYEDIERFGGAKAVWKKKDGSLIPVLLSGRKTRDAFGVVDGFEVIAEETHEDERQLNDTGRVVPSA